ncbi:MAG: glycosyl transferase family 2, partial [Candidatus Omnitrophica bacterium]|nr:glycosyl transferase family 2 [Candidatus Omnitrophota bacterium]
AKGGIRFGIFQCDARYPGYEKEALTPSETFSSGFGAFSREKFLALGGYDDRYLPGILEDVDLCYRARKAGYHLYYEPQSVVYHMGQVSFKKEFGVTETAVLAHRNTFLFMWKNYSGFSFWIRHLFFLPLRLAFAACRGKWPMLIGFYRAVKMTVKGKV